MSFQHPLAMIALEITARRNVVSLDAYRDLNRRRIQRDRNRRLCEEIAAALGEAYELTLLSDSRDDIDIALDSLRKPQ